MQDDGRKQHTGARNIPTCPQEAISAGKGKHPTILQQEANHQSHGYHRVAQDEPHRGLFEDGCHQDGNFLI